MARLLTLSDLQAHFEQARDKLSRDRLEILAAFPLSDAFSPNEYGFTYMRAERIGMEVISHSLREVAWLPMRLDPQAEIVLENKKAMKRWLGTDATCQPDSKDFGNDLIHTLARAAMTHGWQSNEFRAVALRVGELFHDLSCLIGLIYYGVWMSENGIEGLPISDPDDLERTAQEIAYLTRSPEVAWLLQNRKKMIEEKKKSSPPVLRVIVNENWDDGVPGER